MESILAPGLGYWFPEVGKCYSMAFEAKELVSIDRGGGVYVLDPNRQEYCCLAQHHYIVCRLSDTEALILLNREVLETDFRTARRWAVDIGDWLEFEDRNLGFNEEALRSLWRVLSAGAPKETYHLEFLRASKPL